MVTGSGSAEGEIHVAGNVSSLTDSTSIWVSSLSGNARISIDGSLFGYYLEPTVKMDSLLDNAALAVDWDGDDYYDYWSVDNASVQVGSTFYHENSPEHHIWEIQPCRGDLNNDGVVDNFDIDPFVLALVDPDGYEDEFPGLEGSRVYHGDCNCSGLFNSFDIDSFVDLVEGNCCDSECPGCASFARGGGGPNPADIAAILAESVAAERYDALLTIVSDVAASDEPNAEFWAQVLETLGG
ncbi:MAG: hypothetical protein JNG88_17745 [Phycisphaerales bacterium]|nr:hypothetical protein [Phycisphaerales bacterium]